MIRIINYRENEFSLGYMETYDTGKNRRLNDTDKEEKLLLKVITSSIGIYPSTVFLTVNAHDSA